MSESSERSLFTLGATDAQERMDEIFAGAGATSVYQLPFARALMLAEAAAQKASLEALQHLERRAAMAPPTTFKTVEQLIALYFDGTPAGIDLLVWDREGFIHGWSFAKGEPVTANTVSYPATVCDLRSALRSFVPQLSDWATLLEQHAAALEQLLDTSRTRALAIAAQRVERRPWWRRLLKKRAVAREMASLGFTKMATAHL